jgi:hypothetical protein
VIFISRFFTIFEVLKNSLNALKKYFFGLLVTLYVITAAGVPVYLHYCGGELENINYVVKGTSCCGEDESTPVDNDCCQDEETVMQSLTDFTLKDISKTSLVKSAFQLFHTPFQNFSCILNSFYATPAFNKADSPPRLLHALVIKTSVLRI